MKSNYFYAILFLLVFFTATTSSAKSLRCKFKSDSISGIDSIEVKENYLILNKEMEIPLEKTRVECGHFGRQIRLDGSALGFQVILKSCTTDAKMEGHIIDSVNITASDVECFSLKD